MPVIGHIAMLLQLRLTIRRLTSEDVAVAQNRQGRV
jgi:hypothetical protein